LPRNVFVLFTLFSQQTAVISRNCFVIEKQFVDGAGEQRGVTHTRGFLSIFRVGVCIVSFLLYCFLCI